MRGWGRLYATSVGLGLRCLLRHGYEKEALVRILVPMDPSRYLELPWAERTLAARPGERVLDLASPKLLAVALGVASLAAAAVGLMSLALPGIPAAAAGLLLYAGFLLVARPRGLREAWAYVRVLH